MILTRRRGVKEYKPRGVACGRFDLISGYHVSLRQTNKNFISHPWSPSHTSDVVNLALSRMKINKLAKSDKLQKRSCRVEPPIAAEWEVNIRKNRGRGHGHEKERLAQLGGASRHTDLTCLNYHLDGIDLEWEYHCHQPNGRCEFGDGGKPGSCSLVQRGILTYAEINPWVGRYGCVKKNRANNPETLSHVNTHRTRGLVRVGVVLE